VRNTQHRCTWLRLLVNMYFPSGDPKSTTWTYQSVQVPIAPSPWFANQSGLRQVAQYLMWQIFPRDPVCGADDAVFIPDNDRNRKLNSVAASL
jgi:hypothetical protein